MQQNKNSNVATKARVSYGLQFSIILSVIKLDEIEIGNHLNLRVFQNLLHLKFKLQQ